MAFPNDPLRNKALVYSVLILEILQTIIITRSAFHVFGEGYGNFSFFNDVELAWLDVPVLTGISTRTITLMLEAIRTNDRVS